MSTMTFYEHMWLFLNMQISTVINDIIVISPSNITLNNSYSVIEQYLK